MTDTPDDRTAPRTPPRYAGRRLSDHILIAFHQACDQGELEVARLLLDILEMMIAAPRLPHLVGIGGAKQDTWLQPTNGFGPCDTPNLSSAEDADANRCRRPWHELDVRPLRTRVDARCRVARVGGRADLVGPAELTARPGRGRGPAHLTRSNCLKSPRAASTLS
jgi:hypothetical protein